VCARAWSLACVCVYVCVCVRARVFLRVCVRACVVCVHRVRASCACVVCVRRVRVWRACTQCSKYPQTPCPNRHRSLVPHEQGGGIFCSCAFGFFPIHQCRTCNKETALDSCYRDSQGFCRPTRMPACAGCVSHLCVCAHYTRSHTDKLTSRKHEGPRARHSHCTAAAATGRSCANACWSWSGTYSRRGCQSAPSLAA